MPQRLTATWEPCHADNPKNQTTEPLAKLLCLTLPALLSSLNPSPPQPETLTPPFCSRSPKEGKEQCLLNARPAERRQRSRAPPRGDRGGRNAARVRTQQRPEPRAWPLSQVPRPCYCLTTPVPIPTNSHLPFLPRQPRRGEGGMSLKE